MAAPSVSPEIPKYSNSNNCSGGKTLGSESNQNDTFYYEVSENQPETVDLDLSVKCRGCFAEEPEMHFLFTNFDQELSLADILMQTTPFLCSEDDGFPPYLCIKCTSCLVAFFNFKMQYHKTQVYIRSLLEKPPKSEFIAGNKSDIKQEVSETQKSHFDNEGDDNDDLDKFFERSAIDESNDHYSEDFLPDYVKKCPDCKDEFPINTFQAHRETHKINICPVSDCNYKTVRKPDLKLHLQTRHSEDRNFVCQTCGFKFKSKQLLKRHEKRHLNLRSYCCETCGMRFNDLGPMRTHIKLKHIGTREFVCTICGLDFPLKGTLDKHILRHNKNRPAPYNCDQCSMRFQDKCSLRRHKKVKHSGEFVRPMCQYCDKTYCSVSKMKQHVERHHGLEPYVSKQRGRKPKSFSEEFERVTEYEEDFVSDEWDSEEEEESEVEENFTVFEEKEVKEGLEEVDERSELNQLPQESIVYSEEIIAASRIEMGDIQS